jgi:hypothetical protein
MIGFKQIEFFDHTGLEEPFAPLALNLLFAAPLLESI